MKDPKILAFMQNPWFKPGTAKEVVDKYRTDQEFHRRLLARSMSGFRIYSAFGPDLYDKIWWDNVAPEATDHPNGIITVDMQHVELTIRAQQPNLIITFGKIAENAMDRSLLAADIPYMCCKHPNARHTTSEYFGSFAIDVSNWIDEWRIKQ